MKQELPDLPYEDAFIYCQNSSLPSTETKEESPEQGLPENQYDAQKAK
jgi:hypothetical protein